MIDNKYKPIWLPQVSSPFSIILDKLGDEGIGYELMNVNPNQLLPSQPFVFSDDVNYFDDNNDPIWASNDMKVIDGHSRLVNKLQNNKNIDIIKIGLSHKDACRVLNKIQDIIEYDDKLKNETDDTFNNNDISSLIENDDNGNSFEGNKKTLIGYRKNEINETSGVGNFFMLTPTEGYGKYEIEFENLLDTSELGLVFKSGQNPVDILCKVWYPNINFDELSNKNSVDVNKLKNKAIVAKAKKYGFDGIKYGEKLIQGLK
jgi:hypothetical protein